MAPVETLEKLERRITLNILRDDVQTEMDKRLKVRARTAKAPGFRPGKVPMNMVVAQYGDQTYAEILHEMISASFSAAASENELHVAGQPEITAKTEDVADGHIAFYATFEVYPEVKIGDLAALEIEKTKTDIGEEDVERTIDVLRKGQAHFHVKGELGEHGDGGPVQTAQTNDRVTIDFTGTIDGVEFEGGKSENYAFIIGQGHMLPEFETAVVGMSVGESKKFPLTFPADYQGKDVAGKTAEFTVVLNKLEWAHMPEVDADFARLLGVADGDVGKLRQEVRDNLERESEKMVQAANKNGVMDALLKVADFDVPKALVDQEIEHLMEMTRMNMAQKGMNSTGMKLPPELFTTQAERRVRLGLILGDLVKTNNLNATPEQVRAEVEKIGKSYQDQKMVVDYYYANRDRLAEVESLVVEENVVNYVLGKSKVTEKVIPFAELATQKQQ